MSELKPFISGSRLAPNFEKVLHEVSDIEADEEFYVEEIKGITHNKRILYDVKWLGLPKKDWTFEPYENSPNGAQELLLEFHKKHPNAPRDYRLKGSATTASAMT